ncbi:hypothetical protein [Sinomicrobium weinanense]|uniref:Uncharacterized protein n=1 Tax=Sinomicrobium weinanense TaxID=2842200 RepID=A0A926JUI1_9FLAO|nr:hypothetical protein [Sinomicrobium weinanense]MBC9797564.1 hypothetical protein [Sinomicrobium weinanense]MBU3123919.1 hypothetical protein [Sinomicrobium weinanense]
MALNEKLVAIKEASLTNNCPECYADTGLILTFYQKHIKSRWYKKVTGEVSNILRCNKCDTTIYPVKWTDDIERVLDYYSKTVTPGKTSFRLTRLSYILILLLIAIIAGGIVAYRYLEKPIL